MSAAGLIESLRASKAIFEYLRETKFYIFGEKRFKTEMVISRKIDLKNA